MWGSAVAGPFFVEIHGFYPMPNGRDDKGRFLKGNPGGPGRPPKGESLTEALKAKADKQELADILIGLAKQGDLAALKYVYDRIDGSPRQTIDQTWTEMPAVVGYYAEGADTRSADSEDTDADSE